MVGPDKEWTGPSGQDDTRSGTEWTQEAEGKKRQTPFRKAKAGDERTTPAPSSLSLCPSLQTNQHSPSINRYRNEMKKKEKKSPDAEAGLRGRRGCERLS